MIEEGHSDLMFLGDCVGKYGIDIDSSLPDLIDSFQKEYPSTRFAVQHLYPKDFLEFKDEFKRYIEDGKIIHLNLPIQSASDKILFLMNRHYRQSDIRNIFEFLLELNFSRFDTHLIVGFPEETLEDFIETMEVLRLYKPTYVLMSKYYDAPMSESYKLGNKVSSEEIEERIQIAKKIMTDEGIIFNIDGEEFIRGRFSRINKAGE
jgi:tRNA A37 methylthiotransferase MiaB